MVSQDGEPGRIRFGLTAIKNVGEHICDVIYRERKAHGPYTDLEDFLGRIDDKDLNKKSVESLAKAGALDCFGIDRGVLLSNIENILHFIKQKRESAVSNQGSLFAGTDIALDSKVVLKDAEPATMDIKLEWEKALLGIYVSSHPFSHVAAALEGIVTPIKDLEEYPRDEWIITGGVIESCFKKITKKGSQMMFFTLLDRSGSAEYLVFPKTYEITKDVWEVGRLVVIVGKTPKEDGDNKIFVENVYVINKENAEEIARQIGYSMKTIGKDIEMKQPVSQLKQVVEPFVITTTKELLQAHTADIKHLLQKYTGASPVQFDVQGTMIETEYKVAVSEELKDQLRMIGCDV
jgi:DNA polymerase-3 subunit alpha